MTDTSFSMWPTGAWLNLAIPRADLAVPWLVRRFRFKCHKLVASLPSGHSAWNSAPMPPPQPQPTATNGGWRCSSSWRHTSAQPTASARLDRAGKASPAMGSMALRQVPRRQWDLVQPKAKRNVALRLDFDN